MGDHENKQESFEKDMNVATWELNEVKDEKITLKTDRTKCVVCSIGDVIPHKRGSHKAHMIVYGRNGSYKVNHQEYICNNQNKFQPCRASYFYGYYRFKGMKVYENDALCKNQLVVSDQTAFDLDYLIEITHLIEICSCNFEGLGKVYNRYHNRNLNMDLSQKREDLCRKRLTEAYFLYCYLEMGQRYNIPNYQVIGGDLDSTILQHQEELQNKFRRRWFQHRCDVPGRGTVLTVDGGLKPHRMLCGAKMAGVQTFKSAGVTNITGCTRHPQPDSKYCWEHLYDESHIIPADRVSSRTRQQLRGHRNDTAIYKDAGEDKFFIIEQITDMKKSKGKSCYKVKWFSYPISTWEDEESIPAFIRDYYSLPGKLGTNLPDANIKATKKIGESEIHLLSWGGSSGDDKWCHEDLFKILNDDGELVSAIDTPESCNTRKSRDKRENRHTVGVFVGAYPCGTIVLNDELYGSESISQVYGILINWLSNLHSEERKHLLELLYDDNCHMKKYSENPERADRNEITKFFAELDKHIDRFHFRNHVDPWCQENLNPQHVENLKGVNTQICEQLFKKVNAHKNCKSFNESRFFLFFLYNFDLHNMSIEGIVSKMADPREDFRWSNIDIQKVSQKLISPTPMQSIEGLLQKLELALKFTCNLCGSGYSKVGFLKAHLEKKHETKTSDTDNKKSETLPGMICEECGKVLGDKRSLERHMKSHLKCTTCGQLFKTWQESKLHKQNHVTCQICQLFCEYPSKLKTHMKTHI